MTKADIAVIGTGTMGAALALNIAENGFTVAVLNRRDEATDAFVEKAGALASNVIPTKSIPELVDALKPPCAILLMVPAGEAVDAQIAALSPHLSVDDLIIDGGNANFRDTNRRVNAATVGFMGIGVSGGEDGARNGPSMMAGGTAEQWDRVSPILTKIAAHHNDTPCAARMGPQGAGHFVKAVHNGIEYADMQLIAEAYGLMRDGLSMETPAIGAVFDGWNSGPLESYLIEISGKVAGTVDQTTGKPLLEVIEDQAGQKGTGRWTAIEAQHLAAPIPVIEAAVAARNISARKPQRVAFETQYGAAASGGLRGQLDLGTLEKALICGKILCYTQGFEMIARASDAFDWDIDLPTVARTWREGCIIRSAMLDDMAAALTQNPILMEASRFAALIKDTEAALREIVAKAVTHGLPVPAMSAALAYFDAMRQGRGTADMIQGQRDFFGWHGFVRRDTGAADQHGPWVG